MTSPSINSLADVVKRLMAKDWGLPLNDGSLNDGLSQSMVKAPRTSELDDVVMVIYLAVDRGMNPAVWLEPEEDEEQGPRRDGEDDLLLTTEFFDRIQSLKLVLRSWEFKAPAVGSVVNGSGDGDDADAGDFSKDDKDLICEMFGVEGDVNSIYTLPFIDVKSFLFHCYERMEDVELKFQAQQVEYEQALLDNSFDDTAIRSSLDELKQSRQARQQERDQEAARMNEFIEQQKRTGEILLSPEVIVTNTVLPHSPYDEEVAFDLDFDDEVDSSDGLAKLQELKERKQGEQVRKMTQLANSKKGGGAAAAGKLNKGAKYGYRDRDSVGPSESKRSAGAKADDMATWRRELNGILGDDDKALQLDVVEDLLRKVVRQSNQFRAVEKRFGFVEPDGGADSHVGPARTKLLHGFRARLSEEAVREGFLAAHLVLTKAQVKLLFLLVVKHAKCRLRKCGFLPHNAAVATVSTSVDLGAGAASTPFFHSRDMRAGGPRPASAPSSPTRTKPLAYSPSSITINSAVIGSARTKDSSSPSSSSSSAGRPHSHSQRSGGRAGSPGDSSVGSIVTQTSARNLRQSLQAAANTMPIVSREKAVLRGKLSAAWLWDYLRLLRLTRKTVPTAAALEILREQLGASSTTGATVGSSDGVAKSAEGDGQGEVGVHGPRMSKRSAAAAIALSVRRQAASFSQDDSRDDSDYVDEDDDDDEEDEDEEEDEYEEDEFGQLPMPRAMRHALAGKYYYIPDHQLDNIVGGYARSAALHGDGAGQHRGVVVPQAYLDKEILMRVQRWVGNVDASNDFQHKLRTALHQHNQLYKTYQKSAALSYEELRLQQQQVRQMLVDEKAEELRSEERLDGSITKELFWKFITYCKEALFRKVCTFSAWLDWRHSNFSSTHREVQAYRTRAGARLRESLEKERHRQECRGGGDNDDYAAGTGSADVEEKRSKAVAFGGTTSIGRFGRKEKSAAVRRTRKGGGGSSLYSAEAAAATTTTTTTTTKDNTHSSSGGDGVGDDDGGDDDAEAVATRVERALKEAEEEQKRTALHLLWKKKKGKEREEREAQEKIKHKKESKDKRRRKKAAETEFKTWLKLRSYRKFAVKDPKTGAVVAIRDHPFNADNPSVRVKHEKAWQSFVGPRPPKVVAVVTKKNTSEEECARDYTVLVKVDVEKEEKEREERVWESKNKSKLLERRKASVPKQKAPKKKEKGRKRRATGASADILDVSVTSI